MDKIRNSLNADEFGYSYDAASNETQRLNYYNSVAQVYTRDVLNRMSRRDLKIGSAAPFSSEVYTFDVMNRVLAIDREDGKRDRFYYNFAGELTSAHYGWSSAGSTRSVGYVLDAVGNRTQVVDAGVSKTYVPDILNRYTSVGGAAITHGPAHQIGAYQTNSYQYVGDTYLASMGPVSGPATYTLGYDALGRCVKRTLQGVTTYYVYDGEKPILEYKANGTLAGSNVYGKGIDEILINEATNSRRKANSEGKTGSCTSFLNSAPRNADALFLSTRRFNTRASHIQCCPRQPELFSTGQHVAVLGKKLSKRVRNATRQAMKLPRWPRSLFLAS